MDGVMVHIGRLLSAMITPFDRLGRVDYAQAQRLAVALVKSGSDGLVITGTTGESPTLTKEEKIRLWSDVKQAVGSGVSVIAGTGSYNTAESIELSREAERAGADATLLVVPYYNKPTDEGLYLHFRTIAESISLPCILYNVPSRTVTNLNAETTLRLSQVTNIIGIKEASGDLEQISRIIEGSPQGFRVWSGNDSDTFGLMCLGAYGVISVASHLVGLQIKAMMDKLLAGHVAESAKEHLRLMPIFSGLFVISNPSPVKHCVNLAGLPVGKPRLPLLEPDDPTSAFLMELMSRYQIDLTAVLT